MHREESNFITILSTSKDFKLFLDISYMDDFSPSGRIFQVHQDHYFLAANACPACPVLPLCTLWASIITHIILVL